MITGSSRAHRSLRSWASVRQLDSWLGGESSSRRGSSSVAVARRFGISTLYRRSVASRGRDATRTRGRRGPQLRSSGRRACNSCARPIPIGANIAEASGARHRRGPAPLLLIVARLMPCRPSTGSTRADGSRTGAARPERRERAHASRAMMNGLIRPVRHPASDARHCRDCPTAHVIPASPHASSTAARPASSPPSPAPGSPPAASRAGR